MKQYHELLQHVLDNGVIRTDRTGTGTISVFGYQNRYDLSKGFPLVNTKKVHWKSIVHELLWFLKGDTNIKYLNDNGITIWDEWANDHGELGPVYGCQWRSWLAPIPCGVDEEDLVYVKWTYIDQINTVIEQIQTNPDSRRLIVTAWNPAEVGDMALPPCHLLFQFYVDNGKLSCQLYQRSADAFLGVPFNIASYALLTHMIAHVCDLEVGEFVHTFGDLHIYTNHVNQVEEQLSRKVLQLPDLGFSRLVGDIDSFTAEDIELIGYYHHPAITAPVAV